MSNKFPFLLLGLGLLFIGCTPTEKSLFEQMNPNKIGIDFSNDLTYTDDFNVYQYRNFYNGGGVAIGDVNNDGWVDVYLTANQKENKLFLNQGGFTFKDATAQAGVGGTRAWSTGVTMVDINADGFLDIYVCNSGDIKGDNKENELFINQGDGTFKEQAKAYNLADNGFSTHAAFFDYDKDGDLDVYLLNNSYQAIGSFDLRRNERPKRDQLGGDKLMENRNGVFVDVSEAAGIYGSVIGFGLGVTLGDVNGDQWEDIFISNDFFERDYLYLNQQDGTFTEVLTEQMRSISGASMGADMADIDNDGKNDLFVTEMLPFQYERLKSVTTFEDWNRYEYNVKNGYHHQFTRNMLHRNNGNNTFSEVGRLAGVEASDWSWGALFFDMNSDGLKDLFVANGIYKDLTDQDYLQYVSNQEVIQSVVQKSKVDYKRLIDIIPSEPVANQSYLNQGDFQFELYATSGLNDVGFSNGAAYGDLDNDGDLDLIVNNVNQEVFVYRNNHPNTQSLQIQLKGIARNTQALGAQVTVLATDNTYYAEQQPTRGFQSSMDPRMHFGIPNDSLVSVKVQWPTGGFSWHPNIKVNQLLFLDEALVQKNENTKQISTDPLFNREANVSNFRHKENYYVDFHRERLMYHMCSNEGPQVAHGDLDGDGKPEIIVPGAKGMAPHWVSTENGESKQIFPEMTQSELIETQLFDADGDGDLDVYMASGGVELSPYSDFLYDRLYLNDGKGNFKDSEQQLPATNQRISTGAVAVGDYDADGDLDLFVGERIKIGQYGLPGSGFLLRNNGQGDFTDMTTQIAPELQNLGMITDAKWMDIDQDKDLDLIVVGEFLGVEMFENQAGRLVWKKKHPLRSFKGWWNTLSLSDVDADGDLDLLVGNHGRNTRFSASKELPIQLFYNDFDQNGTAEGILTFRADDGKDYPYALRHNLIDQIKKLKKKYPDFNSFKDQDISQIFSEKERATALVLEANHLETTLFLNENNWNFKAIVLPQEAQLSPVYAISCHDFDADGDLDILLGGNLYKAKPEVGSYDASYGVYLENLGNNKFATTKSSQGFSEKGEIRDLQVIDNQLWVFKSNDSLGVYKFNSK